MFIDHTMHVFFYKFLHVLINFCTNLFSNYSFQQKVQDDKNYREDEKCNLETSGKKTIAKSGKIQGFHPIFHTFQKNRNRVKVC